MNSYVLASTTKWPIEEFMRRRKNLPGQWSIVTTGTDLRAAINETNPTYVFFPHWSHMVSPSFVEKHECVCFHMTDLPFGRGGSPLQNLISRGITQTKVTAFRMTERLDAGPVYIKLPLSLNGSAESIYRRAAMISLEIMEWMIREEPAPTEQGGEPINFVRRTPDQSLIPASCTPRELYDHIRMLDAEGYPNAFAKLGAWRMEFTEAELDGEEVVAKVRFK